jgi:purine-nucleoside phosphorylase
MAPREGWPKWFNQSVHFIKERVEIPKVAIVAGSGLGSTFQGARFLRSLSFSAIPHFPVPSVEGHKGVLHAALWEGVPCLLLEGRLHLYEGYSPAEVVYPIRVAVGMGAKIVVLTNAAGSLELERKPGSFMALSDHINLTGHNPLANPDALFFGERFLDLNGLYDPLLRGLFLGQAQALGIPACEGIYAGLLGPSLETPAEIRMLQGMGASAVGMSTVLEAIAARQMGASVLGVSCLTNYGCGLADEPLSHEDVLRAAKKGAVALSSLLTRWLGSLGAKAA